MKNALVIIDYVNDFVAANGSLTCGVPAQEIDTAIAQWVEQYGAAGELIVVATDTHMEGDPYHPETRLFPTHCVANSWGAMLYGGTASAVQKLPKEQLLLIPKTRYSAFAGTPLDQKLRERGISHVQLVGVCTDICVLHTAVDAYNLGYRITVAANSVASFNQEGHLFTLAHLTHTLGATVLQ
ncbi:MAG: cysteine hydrolase [Symbiobacteriaceae bacterium]|nr:cysteine hydrolase [Symbiobacteriaceae bacterium]